jgi:hypothetical protein
MASTKTELTADHRQHLIYEGFVNEQINEFLEAGLIESLGPIEAAELFHQVKDSSGTPVTGGLIFKFSKNFSQLRLDAPELIQKPGEKPPRYLSPAIPIDTTCAYIPEGCKVITEGMKDALAFEKMGGIPTGAIAGVSHAVKALPAGCGYTIVFDADAWTNGNVFLALIKAGIHCGGKVAILPTIDGEPKAGACEYFKSGYTAEDLKKLVDDAFEPEQLFEAWLLRQNITSVGSAADVAVAAGKILGALHGYASSKTKGEIKTLLKTPLLKNYPLDFHAVCSDSFNTKESKRANDKAEGEDFDTVEFALTLVKTKAVLFYSPEPDSVEYAEIPTPHNSFKTVPIDSPDFKKWLRGDYYALTGAGIPREDMSVIVETAKAIAAFDAPMLPVSTQRIAAHDGRYFLYLADDHHTVIEYSDRGWNPCTKSPVKFVYDKYKSLMPVPIRGGSIEDLWKFVRISDQTDRLLIITFLVKALVPGGTDPILALSGYQDTGKTTAAKYLRALVDPFEKGAVLSKLPSEGDSVAIHCQKRRILAIDNVSHITKDQADFLCGVSTGTGLSKRKLHSDSEEILLDVRNLTIITSIGNVVKEGDLLSRSLVIEMSRMTAEERGNETDLNIEYEKLTPLMLGALLDITCAGLSHREKVASTFKQYTRFGDFSMLGEGIELHLSMKTGTLSKRISDGVGIAHDITIEASPVGSMIRSWLTSDMVIWKNNEGTDFKHYWEGNASGLHTILKNQAKKSELASTIPKTAHALSSELKRIESALNHKNIEINQWRDNKGRYLSIKLLTVDGEKSNNLQGENAGDSIHTLTSKKEPNKTASPASPFKNEELDINVSNGFSGDAQENSERHRSVTKNPNDTSENLQNACLVSNDAGDAPADDTKNSKMYIKAEASPTLNVYPEVPTSYETENRSVNGDALVTLQNSQSVTAQSLCCELDTPLSKNDSDAGDAVSLGSFVENESYYDSFEYLVKPQDPNDESTFDQDDEV